MTTWHLCRWSKIQTEILKIESMSLPGYLLASSKEIVFLLNGLSQIHSTACEASLRKQLSNGDHAQLWKKTGKNKRKAKRYSEHVKNVTAASHHWIIFVSILWCGTKESFVKLTRSNFWTLNNFIALSSSAMSFAGWKVDGSCFSRIYLKDTTKWLVCVATKMWKERKEWSIACFYKNLPPRGLRKCISSAPVLLLHGMQCCSSRYIVTWPHHSYPHEAWSIPGISCIQCKIHPSWWKVSCYHRCNQMNHLFRAEKK